MPRYGYDKPWFGFDYGQVHFVVMSTEHDFYRGTEQYHWIKYHLQQVDRSTTPWLIFVGHRRVVPRLASKRELDNESMKIGL